MTRDDKTRSQIVHKQRESQMELRILGVGGIEHVGGQVIQGKEVEKPLRRGGSMQIMGEIVQFWWELLQNMCAVAFCSRITSIMAIIGRKGLGYQPCTRC